jgi:hypothetical protein
MMVHVQFIHCRVITLTLLKVLEATFVVFVIRLWSEMPESLELVWNTTREHWGQFEL